MISCKLHIFCVIWKDCQKDCQNIIYLLPNREAGSMHLPQVKEKPSKQPFLCHRAGKFLAAGMQDPKLLWHISCTLTQNSTGRNRCLTSPSTDNKHNKHMGCISVEKGADKFLIYSMLSEAGSILWLRKSPTNSGFHEEIILSPWKEIYLEICWPEAYEKYWVTAIFRKLELKQKELIVLEETQKFSFSE